MRLSHDYSALLAYLLEAVEAHSVPGDYVITVVRDPERSAVYSPAVDLYLDPSAPYALEAIRVFEAEGFEVHPQTVAETISEFTRWSNPDHDTARDPSYLYEYRGKRGDTRLIS